MNNSIFFIFFLIAGISCSEPKSFSKISEVYTALEEQKHFHYNVEYSINKAGVESSISSIHGLVALNRNSDSGISSAYFGLDSKSRPNYIHSIYLKNDWIYELSSNSFSLNNVDIITDSLHSPILINPELLFKIEADSVKIIQQRINENNIKWTFDLKQKSDQLILLWDDKLNKITELEYRYDFNSDQSYSRKWTFEYLAKSEFSTLEKVYKNQNQITHQPFL